MVRRSLPRRSHQKVEVRKPIRVRLSEAGGLFQSHCAVGVRLHQEFVEGLVVEVARLFDIALGQRLGCRVWHHNPVDILARYAPSVLSRTEECGGCIGRGRRRRHGLPKGCEVKGNYSKSELTSRLDTCAAG